MRKSRFAEEQIVGVLKEAEAGLKVETLCRKHGISQHTLYRWKAKYGGLEVIDARRLKSLEEENRRLKTIVADLTPDKQMLKEVVQRSVWSAPVEQWGSPAWCEAACVNVSGL